MQSNTLPDELIITGFREFNHRITKEYFYGYCRKAYNVFDYKYQLHGKTGLDFYSLAHEYYIQLLQHGFRQLTDRPEGTPLATWMTGGFRYVVLEALKAYNMEFEALVDASSDEVVEYVRSSETEEGFLYDVTEAVCEHYNDRVMQEIAHMVLLAGYKQKEVAEHLGITPAAVNQRYKKMMDEVVTPYVVANYSRGISVGQMPTEDACPMPTPAPCASAPAPRPAASAPCASEAAPRHYQSSSPDFLQRFPKGLLGGFTLSHFKKEIMHPTRITPRYIATLQPNEIFVFGSNLQGLHAGGAARVARQHFGAAMGQGVGLQGQSYAIPTMQGGVETIRPYVDEFITFAKAHPEWTFLVTPIGCGIAGFEPTDIAPLFFGAKEVENISLPASFWPLL